MTPAERLYAAAHLAAVDRPPCVCPGGMMNMIVSDIMRETGCTWPESHLDPAKMASLTRALCQNGGFENYGVPFCMTVEAEALGADVDMGDGEVEPHVVRSPLSSALEADRLRPFDPDKGRPAVVLEAIRLLKAAGDGVPVVGNLTGPISVAGTLVDMSSLLMEFRKRPEACHRLLGIISDALIAFGRAQVKAGADVICIAEPSGTGEILGGKRFQEYAVTYINRVLDAVPAPTKIVHICGRLRSVYHLLDSLHCDAFSFDAMVGAHEVKPYLTGKAVMGNVSTHALGVMPREKVKQLTAAADKQGMDILAPACGLPLTTPLANIKAMAETARELTERPHA
ncbi:uroporphyrinogen decarboxylase family protein [Cloacibacillus evryensis]|uniref:uroporphyrinogen decarboxylase family protein n=1 Tax=Cloacibacillus evryensis TaxID=508460 RepID=UPI003AB681B4